jgi:hypothetical protein
LAQIRINREYFPHVLHDESVLGDELSCKEAPSFFLCLDRVNERVLVELKPSILAKRANRTRLRLTFNHHKPVDAPLVTFYPLLRSFCFFSQLDTSARGSLCA